MAATNSQTLSIEKLCFRIVVYIYRQQIFSTLEMTFVKSFLRNRNEFASRICGSGRLREPFYFRRPEYILFTLHQPIDVGEQLFIGMNGNTFTKLLVTFNRREVVSRT